MVLGVLVNNTLFNNGKVNEAIRNQLLVEKIRKIDDNNKENRIIMFKYGDFTTIEQYRRLFNDENIPFDEIYDLGSVLDINDLTDILLHRNIQRFISNDLTLDAHIERVCKDKVCTSCICDKNQKPVAIEDEYKPRVTISAPEDDFKPAFLKENKTNDLSIENVGKSYSISKDRNDMIAHPSHYTSGKIECIDAIESMICKYPDPVDAILSYQILKYLWRHPFKWNALEDLKKCSWYLTRLIDKYEKGEIKFENKK